MAAHRSDVSALAYLEPARLLATGGTDGGIKLWQLGGDAAVAATVGAAARGQAPRAAAPQLREPLQHLKGHAGELTRLVFTPDGSSLVSGDSRGGLRVWDVQCGAAGALLHALGGHSGGITGLVCHPEERLFVSCSADKTLRVWDVDLPTPRCGAVLVPLPLPLSWLCCTTCWRFLPERLPTGATHASPPFPPSLPVPTSRCIGVHGPEGRREVRGVAFAPGGRALMAAYPDGLRVFTLDPLTLQDTADLQWSRVRGAGQG